MFGEGKRTIILLNLGNNSAELIEYPLDQLVISIEGPTPTYRRPLKNFIFEKVSTIYSADFLFYLRYMVALDTQAIDFPRFSVALLIEVGVLKTG